MKKIIIDNIETTFSNERNVLEVARKIGIELPTFCYQPELSIFGSCRMCVVEVDGRGVLPACSTVPWDGMIVHTNTQQIRGIRKMILEMMLASHDQQCTTCPKSENCKLQSFAKQHGIDEVRFQSFKPEAEKDFSSTAITRDQTKCVLCGNCVRICDEVQSVDALKFSFRGAKAKVGTFLERGIGFEECIGCGQCVKVCPVGALNERHNIEEVWQAVYDKSKTVVVQISPATRVTLGELFGKSPGTKVTGKIITALKRMGFDKVFDTCFAADFTVVEEGKELLERKKAGEKLPMFTSCCPAWVKFAEQNFPNLVGNLSSCKSPQQMLGSLIKDRLTKDMNIKREDLVVVALMPCTAKKFEVAREEFKVNGNPDVDFVLTTNELALMIKERGIDFNKLKESELDEPFGLSTGAGIIFGSSGGVSEAVLRFAADSLEKGSTPDFKKLRADKDVKITELTVSGETLKLAAVSGLRNARELIQKIQDGDINVDIVEVMACSGGCVNGGGQPPALVNKAVSKKRAGGLYTNDKKLEQRISSNSPGLKKIYAGLDDKKTHDLLHTHYEHRQKNKNDGYIIDETPNEKSLHLDICFGASCLKSGGQELYLGVMKHLRENNLVETTEFKATYCMKICTKGPSLRVNGKQLEKCSVETAISEINKAVK
ncbi:MAG: [FeFe] hydrogenase, group A [Firmicutes bacterium]|nr:[FeFe] hydrogenase, group A [Bacillota bacterium]